MADTEKGNSSAESKKKSAVLDEDFGKDFLNFWGPSKKGKDQMDFDMEEVLRNKKNSFNFDKLDDFELGGDFGKLQSFKMDMSDLDFSSPAMNAKKAVEKPKGKQDMKHEKFSFNFDFNELDKFDLGSSPVKGDKKSRKCADSNASDCSFKHVKNQDSRSNSETSTDAFKDLENKKPLKSDNMASSRPQNLITASITNDSPPSISQDLENHDACPEVQTSSEKQISVAEEDPHREDCHAEQPQETCLTKINSEKNTQDFILQSLSGDCSAQENNPQFSIGATSSDAVKADPAEERDDSMRIADNSRSWSSSPVASYNKESCPKIGVTELANTSVAFEKHCKRNQSEVTGGDEIPSEATKDQNDIQNASCTDSKINNTNGMKNAGVKQNPVSKFIPSTLARDSRVVNPKSLNEKVAASLQLTSLRKSTDNASWKISSAMRKQLDTVCDNKLKTSNAHPASEYRESKQTNEQAETWKTGLLKSHGEHPTKATSDFSGSERNDDQSASDTFRVAKQHHELGETQNISILKSYEKEQKQDVSAISGQKNKAHNDIPIFKLEASVLQQKIVAKNTAKSIIPNSVSSVVSGKSSKIVPIEINRSSTKVDKTFDSRSNISSKTKLNYKTTEAKSVRFSEGNSGFFLQTEPKANFIEEKSASLAPPLKRKSFEDSTDNPKKLNPLKRVMKLTIGRKSLEISPRTEKAALSVPEKLEAHESCAVDLDSSGFSEVGDLTGIELPAPLEKDDEKAFDSRLNISNITKSNRKVQNSAASKEADPARGSESNSEFPLEPASTMAYSITEKRATTPLKRKAFEVPVTEKLEASYTITCAGDSTGAPELGGLAGLEVVPLAEKDENLEKAEAYMNKLDDMCHMLRKKHEEARELLVRAVVNNNTLMMLNHPLFDEKISFHIHVHF
ncbi:uncharacterized protein A4U43_C01F4210 [Asparagus officinalis]|uniref:Uncharacterized protein n=1 Tax=Asparagus officinalis TaxID=4686 RepID=A0A5P1FLN2_ASPOF|nr:uncharacterized protein A4U43_C01F4210 [Asparagus officinalis]